MAPTSIAVVAIGARLNSSTEYIFHCCSDPLCCVFDFPASLIALTLSNPNDIHLQQPLTNSTSPRHIQFASLVMRVPGHDAAFMQSHHVMSCFPLDVVSSSDCFWPIGPLQKFLCFSSRSLLWPSLRHPCPDRPLAIVS